MEPPRLTILTTTADSATSGRVEEHISRSVSVKYNIYHSVSKLCPDGPYLSSSTTTLAGLECSYCRCVQLEDFRSVQSGDFTPIKVGNPE